MFVGFGCAVVCGFGLPMMIILFSMIMESMLMQGKSHKLAMIQNTTNYSAFLAIVGFVELLSNFGMYYFWSKASEKLALAVRMLTFDHALKLGKGYYHTEYNNANSLVSSILIDADSLKSAGGTVIGVIVSMSVGMIGCMIIAISTNWRLGLTCMIYIPIFISCGVLHNWVSSKYQSRALRAYEISGSYIFEAVSSIRTVKCFASERHILRKYYDEIENEIARTRRKTVVSTLFYALAQGISPLIMCLCFWYGSKLLKDHVMTTFHFFAAFLAIMVGSQASTNMFNFSPEFDRAKSAIRNISRVTEIQPQFDNLTERGRYIDRSKLKGALMLDHISFAYPLSPDIVALSGIKLTIPYDLFVAFVGTEGSGKTTLIYLLGLLYTAPVGRVIMDRMDIRDYNPCSYRKIIGWVVKEPEFAIHETIGENIALAISVGKQKSKNGDLFGENILRYEVVSASEAVGLHDRISALPLEYDTVLIDAEFNKEELRLLALTQALARKCKILLVDDYNPGEHQFCEALLWATKDRTVIVTTNNLKNIEHKVHWIYVFSKGRLVEGGIHAELVNKKGGKYSEIMQLDL